MSDGPLRSPGIWLEGAEASYNGARGNLVGIRTRLGHKIPFLDPFLEFSPNIDQGILRACGVPGFSFLAAFFPEPDVREPGMLQLRVIDRSDRGRNFAAKQSVQRIEDEYDLNAKPV